METLCVDTLSVIIRHTLEATNCKLISTLRTVCKAWMVITDGVYPHVLRGQLIAQKRIGEDDCERISIESAIQYVRPIGPSGWGHILDGQHQRSQMLAVYFTRYASCTLMVETCGGRRTNWLSDGGYWRIDPSWTTVDATRAGSLIYAHVRLMETVFPELAGRFLPCVLVWGSCHPSHPEHSSLMLIIPDSPADIMAMACTAHPIHRVLAEHSEANNPATRGRVRSTGGSGPKSPTVEMQPSNHQ